MAEDTQATEDREASFSLARVEDVTGIPPIVPEVLLCVLLVWAALRSAKRGRKQD